VIERWSDEDDQSSIEDDLQSVEEQKEDNGPTVVTI